MKEGDLRGLSTIVTTLIIILLVIIAVGIVWVVIRNVISKGAEEVELGKFTLDLEIESVKITDTNVNVKVKRNTGAGEVQGILFLIFDGNDTYNFEKKDITLEVLERKTFVVDYTGKVVSVSIAPMFKRSSGEWAYGNIIDVYQISGTGDEYEGCVPDCQGKECGDNGCGGSCGDCPVGKPFCVQGICEEDSGGCVPNCTCAAETCIGQTCSDGCEGSCSGTLTIEQDCGEIMCGDSPHGCGSCGSCEDGYFCDGGICVLSCIPDCDGKECGDNGCEGSCGECNVSAGEWCDNGTCSVEQCEPDCGERNCGPVPNGCGENCGVCNLTAGEYCSDEGMCVLEYYLNTGTVYSVWPINIGIYFDSEDLPTSGVTYTNYYAKFTTGLEDRCLQIREFVTPIVPEIYNLSYIRFVTSSTSVQPGDVYEIWETYEGCQS